MFKYNPAAKYEPNGGKFLQRITAKDLYEQQIVVKENSLGEDEKFTANFPNVFTNFVVPSMRVESVLYKNWVHQPMKLWQTQLNFAVFCASSACGVSSAHLNFKTYGLVRSVYRFHVYFQIRQILKRMQVALPNHPNFNTGDNPYSELEFLNICHDFKIPKEPIRYRFEKFFATYQTGSIYDDAINPNSMFRFTIPTGNGFTDIGLEKISESIRAYAYLILTSQASARSNIVGKTASTLTARRVYLHNFEDIVNRRVDIQEDIKRFQDTLNYASSRVDYSVGERLYMLPSDMNLRIKQGVKDYNNKILVSNVGLSLAHNAVNLPKEKKLEHQPSKQVHSSSPKHKTAKPQNREATKAKESNDHPTSIVETNKVPESSNQSHHSSSQQSNPYKAYSQSTLEKLEEEKKKKKHHEKQAASKAARRRAPEEPEAGSQSSPDKHHRNPKRAKHEVAKQEKVKITPEEEKIVLIITIVCAFTAWRLLT